jgi:hypothetical protein
MSHFPIVFHGYYAILVISRLFFLSRSGRGIFASRDRGWALRAFAAERPGGQ